MDCKKTIWQKVPPVLPTSKFPVAEFPTLTTTELAEWTIHLDKTDQTVVFDPVAVEELKAQFPHLTHDHTIFDQSIGENRPVRLFEAVVIHTLKRVVLNNRALVDALVAGRKDSMQRTSAPKIGWTILAIVCDREDLERSAGDLEEWYPIYLRERGRVATNIWYWAQITRTVMCRLWPAVERVLKLAELFSKVRSG